MYAILFLIIFSINSYIAIKEYNLKDNKSKILFIFFSLILSLFIIIKSSFIINFCYASVMPLLIINSVIDIKTLTLSKKITFLIYIQGFIGLLIALLFRNIEVSYFFSCILNSILVYLVYLFIAVCSNGKFGGGDVKLIFAIGIFFTFNHFSQIIVYPLIIGTIVGILLMIFKKYKAQDFFALGPCIAITSYILFFIK